MPFFSAKGGKLARLREAKFDYEKDLQKLVEENLDELFGLELIKSEFQIKKLYFDTLAFDHENSTFAIIEYKRDRSFSIIDQGFAYLAALLDNKADAILEYQDRTGKQLKRTDIRWDQTRVIFIAPQFTPHQKGAIAFKDVSFELWEAQVYENGFCAFAPIKATETQESISKFTESSTVKTVSTEVKTFTFEDHRERAAESTRSLLDDLRSRIFQLNEGLTEKPVQNYLGYKISWYNFVTIHVYKERLRVHVRLEKVSSDTQTRFTKVPTSYGWGKTPLWWLDVTNATDVNYVMPAIEESYSNAPDR